MIGHIELAKCSFHNFQLNLTIYRRSESKILYRTQVTNVRFMQSPDLCRTK